MTEGLALRIDRIVERHGQRGLLLDTNVLLLLLAKELVPAVIGQGRLEKYDAQAANLLSACAGRFRRLLTTAHVLAETSNLAAMLVHGRIRQQFFVGLHALFCNDALGRLQQIPVENKSIDLSMFVRLGLTDAGLISLAQSGCLLLTDDLNLYVTVVSRGLEAINFTHMREAAGLL